MSGDFMPVTAEREQPPAAPAAADEHQPPRGLWARLVALSSDTAAAADRLSALDAAVAARPDAPANYLLRAELYARLGEDALALADFSQAQTLAASGFERNNWGLVSQALRDRAAVGAARARQRLARLARPANDE